MLAGVCPRRLLAEIRNFQDGQDGGVLAEAAKTNLTCQPLPDRCPARLAGGGPATCRSNGIYRLRA